jgi:hypothetical protein
MMGECVSRGTADVSRWHTRARSHGKTRERDGVVDPSRSDVRLAERESCTSANGAAATTVTPRESGRWRSRPSGCALRERYFNSIPK